MFAHGFNIRFARIAPPAGVDVGMVAPKGPGHLVRSFYRPGGGVPALFAVEQDATGTARARTLAYAPRARRDARRRPGDDLQGGDRDRPLRRAVVLCGGTAALVKMAFETLVKAGYQPELAYFETLHELKLIVDLMYRGGLNFMRFSVSDTAEYGDYVSGPRIIDERTRATMEQVLREIQDGSFAARWIAETETGRVEFERLRAVDRDHQIEQVGARLRAGMAFLDPVTVVAGQAQAAASGAAAGATSGATSARRPAPRGSVTDACPRTGRPVRARGHGPVFDTTLRDGEQGAPAQGGALKNRRPEKLEVARQPRPPQPSTSSRPASPPPRPATGRRSTGSRKEVRGVSVRRAGPLPRR